MLAQLERTTPLKLYAAPQVAGIADLPNHVTALDSATNGFALVLYRMLAAHGVRREHCRFESIGGVKARWDALREGRTAATLLVPPFDDMAEAAGFRCLAVGSDHVPDYPGVVVTAKRGTTLDAYLVALREADAWAGAHRAEAIAILTQHGQSRAAAEAAHADRAPGLVPSRRGLQAILDLRAENGLLKQPAPSPDTLIA